MTSSPSPSSITLSAFKVALEFYPSIAEKVYKSKLKDDKKVVEALERDQWRFKDLPTTVASTKLVKGDKATKDVKGGGLSKSAVERLVQWKITHGHSRPFLPGMVRKNEASAIEKQTSLGFEKLGTSASSETPATATLIAALELVCKLTGIGPATGTLILNVFDPVHIPFFQDEMFLWFFPDLKNSKLKYTQKEYLQLFEAVSPVLKKLGTQAVELEKVAYVIGHKELLDDAERTKLEAAVGSSDKLADDNGNIETHETKPHEGARENKPKTSGTTVENTKGTKRPSEAQHVEGQKQSTKRQSRRIKK